MESLVWTIIPASFGAIIAAYTKIIGRLKLMVFGDIGVRVNA